MRSSIWFATGGEAAAHHTTQALSQRAYRVLRSFDLRSAAAHWAGAGHTECQCPHHGTDQCTCQYIVLLAYAPNGTSAVITIHSRDTRSEVQIVEATEAPAAVSALDPVVLAVLEAAAVCQAAASARILP